MENQSPFVFQVTSDSSPTLSVGENGEWMHHRQGAFSETLYIYGEAISQVMQMSTAPSFVSVGLGLGYVELLLAAHATRESLREVFAVRTFESDPFLRSSFVGWLSADPKTPSDFVRAYDSILMRTAVAMDVPPTAIRDTLAHWLERGSWSLEGALDAQTTWDRAHDGILYDAFSADTTPVLWSPSFLDGLLKQAAAPRCVFASYAATGDLKRALERNHFQVEPRPGFSGKRECTLARRP